MKSCMKRLLKIIFSIGLIVAAPFYKAAFASDSGKDFGFSLQDKASAGDNSSDASKTPDHSKVSSSSATLPMTGREKFYFYLGNTYGPLSFISSGASAAFSQAFDSIPEWGQGMEGYGKRFGSSFGQKAIKQTITAGFGYILHEDPRYYKSENSGGWQRLLHAVGQSFLSHKDSGGIRPGYSYFLGLTSAVVISRQWHPASESKMEDYFIDGAITFGAYIAKNIYREFLQAVK
jgi:hypothetical protein